ncbi:class I SAM-dependent methyltransferase [Lichenicoccus sp.]|uniref:class I SAM-dependent methyltransferase n=1 Tax=Lichenicoccus sp. TaxID=2781899 RepID=UPI003D108862
MQDNADALLQTLSGAAIAPLFYRPSRVGPDSAWYGHLPFANWVMRAAAPAMFVELGTHAGISYSGFCDAVLSEGLPTRCLAIDTWQGDEHAGFYGEQVFAEFSRFHDQRYGGFSRLLRCRFDEALATFEDGSIDLLHIDGRHLLADIEEDFASWLPKLSRHGVVLLHDTNVRERNFGVWRFWEKVRGHFPSFEFLHAHGLGVLAVGITPPTAILELCRLSTTQAAGFLRDRFAFAGERWELDFAVSRRDHALADLAPKIAEADNQTAHARALQEQLQNEVATLRARLVQADQVLRAQSLELGLARSALADAKAERHRAWLHSEALERRLQSEAEAARSFAEEGAAARDALAARDRELEAARGASTWRLTAPRHRRPAAAPIEAPPAEPAAPAADTVAARPRTIRRVLFVAGEPGTPGSVYRCQRNAAACREAGFEAETVDLYDVNPENLARADLLVIWRATMSPHIETMIRLARAAGTRIAFDVDDLMTRPELARIDIIDGIRTIGSNEADTRAYYLAMLHTMQEADFCIATTEELAAEMRAQRECIHVLPNIFDEATHRAARYARRHRLEAGSDGLIRIGYAGGTRTHQKDFARAAPALARVLEARPQAMLVLFREAANQVGLLTIEEFPELAGHAERIEWRDMVPLAELPVELARFDISLCPLETGNAFCEAKSELKFFEASLAGAATIASPTGPYARAIRDTVTGLLAGNDDAWEAALLRLIDDPALRARMARDAYHDVLWRFGPRRQAELAATLIGALDANPEGDPQSSPAAARLSELGLRRGAYLGRGLPEIPDSEVLFAHDALGDAEVTVVMTSYNYEEHVLAALDSVRAQTLETLDLAVVDDGSTDQSVPLLIEWARRHQDRFNRVQILRTLRNAGLGGARNVVCNAAETPWLMALDSDNRLRPDASATLLAALRQVPQAAFAYPRIAQFGAQVGGAELIMGEPAFDPLRLQAGNYIDAMAMVAKWAWAAAGGYYVRRDAMGWEDYDLWLNLIELGQFGIAVPHILADYRVHQSSMVNAITEQSANKQAMVRFVEERHPWLRLRTRTAKRRE